jgi:hypothetical protein
MAVHDINSEAMRRLIAEHMAEVEESAFKRVIMGVDLSGPDSDRTVFTTYAMHAAAGIVTLGRGAYREVKRG